MSFSGFSEAARLFAQYYTVVEKMRKEFDQNVDAFLDALHGQLKVQLGERLQQRITQDRSRYWWLAEASENKDAHVQLWIVCDAPEIVQPGKLKLTAVAPFASKDQSTLSRFARIAKEAPLSSYCRPASGGPWSLFTVELSYQSSDPVDGLARPIADVLIRLDGQARTAKSGATGGL